MATARENILGQVRKALGKGAGSDLRAAEAYVSEHRQGPRPQLAGGVVDCFRQRAVDMASTVETLTTLADVPGAVARYLSTHSLPALLGEQVPVQGVCWPEFAGLDWAGVGLEIAAQPTRGNDRLGITGAFCAVAETGTVVVVSGDTTPTGTTLLPDTHIAVLSTSRIVQGMEEAFQLIRAERKAMPRGVHFISGPSRTGDIEQTIVLGAHGPYRVHILLIA